ncbi:dihydrofolate synthase / folylpolyglutamate synthase [Caminicella sporogenes DSM 14501]|uniref:tetrahydrofolate synthase n=1 Tax=Caminicella sporogenes DSM 14501 TaxID=1121266 RepID=A0A1M6R7Q0_9FIRM|nr:folylpolyglutamate synthase/dihydrofolate synthase family protein [Caminicella sporogenes]RKD27332.1 bifunctional folylpolyglutamate synthase/dihydrofolate synthase [Caminicella sporogenes]SHK28460.1 dihydrofolate synthase / folylpolyglutamate synthase [Caminicella sporogenes DSM 14501]
MNYREALDFINSTNKFGSKLGLENIKYLLSLIGNPHNDLKVIHVAGTNGKGSTSSFISHILIEEGYDVGLFISPALEKFTDRIKINGKNISERDLSEITSLIKLKIDLMLSEGKEHPTEFEIVTAIAFEYFKRKKVDYVVLEVGLGGRLDATNAVDNPLVSVITPIDFDHVNYLGDTLEKIAYEKAGIIKRNCPVVIHPQNYEAERVIRKICSDKNSKLYIAPVDLINIKKYDEFGILFDVKTDENIYDDLKINLMGKHQANNAVVALKTIEVLKNYHNVNISNKSIRNGLFNARWPGRLEILKRSPLVLIDGAHNLHGAKALSSVLKKVFYDKKIIGVIGILEDKDVDGILDKIVPFCREIIITKPDNPRALSLEKLMCKIKKYNKKVMAFENIKDAVNKSLSLADKDSMILYCGSLYMIGKVRKIFIGKVDI